MEKKIIQFSYNWNNKLENKAFTTIRLHNPTKYKTGETYDIQLNETPKGTATLTDKRTLRIEQLNEFICRIDTGYSQPETMEILKRMYKNIDPNRQFPTLCLIGLLQTRKATTERITNEFRDLIYIAHGKNAKQINNQRFNVR